MRAPRAVTHFSPGSYAARPAQETGLRNLFLAGDWVKGVPHGANGLSQVGFHWGAIKWRLSKAQR